ncbi:MAG: tetratricopeptide repeat protein [Nitrospiraceae bacterium]|nr:tetratricopeptide repeat protein [Nitrospiraceae bacterium]
MNRGLFCIGIRSLLFSILALFLSAPSAIAKANPSRGMAYAYYLQALEEESSGRFADASISLKKAMSFDPKSAAIPDELAHIAIHMDDLKEAEQWAKQAAELEPKNLGRKILLAQIYANENYVAKALGLLNEVLDKDPDNQKALLLTGAIYSQSKDFKRAAKVLERAAKEGGRRSFMAHCYLGRIYRDTGNFSKAERHLKEALKLNPAFVMIYLDLADVYNKEGKTDKAIESYRTLLAQQPYNFKAREQLLMLFIKENRVDEALSEFHQFKNIIQNDPIMGLKVAVLCLQVKRYDDALAILKDIARAYPGQGRIQFDIAIAYEQKGNIDAAIKVLKSIETDDEELAIEVKSRLARLLAEKGQVNQAIRLLKQGLKDRPDTKDWIISLADIYESVNRLSDSEKVIRRALDTTPDDKDLLMHFAMLLDREGQTDEAIDSAKKVLKIDKDNVQALNFLGYTYAEKGIKLDKAQLMIKKALTIRPDDPYIVDSLGWVYYKQGKIEKAIFCLKKAHSLTVNDSVITEHLGDAYMAKGNFHKALQLYQEAIKQTDRPKDRLKLKRKILKAQKALRDCSVTLAPTYYSDFFISAQRPVLS